MVDNDLLTLARFHVPGVGEPVLELVSEGLVNRSFRVLRDGRGYALRLPVAPAPKGDGRPDRPRLPVTEAREWECRVLRSACHQGLAPRVFACEPARQLLVMEWVEGVAWTADVAADVQSQPAVASMLRRVHALSPDGPARSMSVQDWRAWYRQAANAADLDPAQLEAAAAADAALEEPLRRYAALPLVAPRLCHSDVHRHNILVRGEELILLDWEYAHLGDPFWDLACWVRSARLPPAAADHLLEAYLLRAPGEADKERVGVLGEIFDSICLLWGALAARSRSRP